MSEDGEPFCGELFPSSYLVLYCPYNCCDLESPFKEPQELVDHLKCAHKTVINKLSAVLPFFDRYLDGLKKLVSFDSNPDDSLVIGDGDEMDTALRDTLQQQVLVEILSKQEKERQTIHKKPRQCIFCMEYSPTLKDLFSHMYQKHHFNIGLLDNLVMVDEFLSNLENLLRRRICIFCHQVFRSVAALTRHMKNKRHYKIDPKNHHYDKFYISNYLKCGALGNGQKESADMENGDEDDWEDLDEEIDTLTTCLFCDCVFPNPGETFCAHMKAEHNLDWELTRKTFIGDVTTESDTIYDYIKLVTFFRSRMEELCCPFCQGEFISREKLEDHLKEQDHCKVPPKEVWDKTMYMFPLYDDDPLLFYCGDNGE